MEQEEEKYRTKDESSKQEIEAKDGLEDLCFTMCNALQEEELKDMIEVDGSPHLKHGGFQIEVTIDIDADGILTANAEDQPAGNSNQITNENKDEDGDIEKIDFQENELEDQLEDTDNGGCEELDNLSLEDEVIVVLEA